MVFEILFDLQDQKRQLLEENQKLRAALEEIAQMSLHRNYMMHAVKVAQTALDEVANENQVP